MTWWVNLVPYIDFYSKLCHSSRKHLKMPTFRLVKIVYFLLLASLKFVNSHDRYSDPSNYGKESCDAKDHACKSGEIDDTGNEGPTFVGRTGLTRLDGVKVSDLRKKYHCRSFTSYHEVWQTFIALVNLETVGEHNLFRSKFENINSHHWLRQISLNVCCENLGLCRNNVLLLTIF